MKTLILASAAVLTLGFGSAFAATTNTAQNQQQVAMNAQTNSASTGSYYGQSSNGPNGYVGGWQPTPQNSISGGD